MAINLVQAAFRVRTDANAAESGTPTWGATENTSFTPTVGQNFRIRFRIDNTGTTPATGKVYSLYRSIDGGAYAPIGGVHVSSADPTGGVSADDSAITTFRLTAGAGAASPGAYDVNNSVTLNVGKFDRLLLTDAASSLLLVNATDHLVFEAVSQSYTEIEFGLTLNEAIYGHSVQFRVYADGAPLNSYTNTPQVTVAARSLTATGLTVGSPVLGTTVVGSLDLVAAPFPIGSPVLGTPQLTLVFSGGNMTALNVVTGSPVIGAPAFTLRLAITANNVAAGSPVFGVAYFGGFHPVAQNLTVGSPIVPATAITGGIYAITASNFAPASPIIGNAFVGASMFAPAFTIGSPVIGAAGIIQVLFFESLVNSGPEFSIPAFEHIRIPRAHMAVDDLRENGEPTTYSIHANYNDEVILEAEGKTLAGNSNDAWGRMQAIKVGLPLKLEDRWLYVDRESLLELLSGHLAEPTEDGGVSSNDPLIQILLNQIAGLQAALNQNSALLLQVANMVLAETTLLANGFTVGLPFIGIPGGSEETAPPPYEPPPPPPPPSTWPPPAGFLLLQDSSSKLLFTDGTSRLNIIGLGFETPGIVVGSPYIGRDLLYQVLVAHNQAAGPPVFTNPLLQRMIFPGYPPY